MHSTSPFGSAAAQSLLCAGFDAGPELLTHMADGLPTGKTWLRGGESLPSPSCTQGPCKSRSVRKISCTLDADVVSISYNRKVSPALAPTVHLSTLHACIKQAISMLQWHASDMSQAHVDLGMHIISASQASVRACEWQLQYTYHCNGPHLICCLQRQECLDGTPCLVLPTPLVLDGFS